MNKTAVALLLLAGVVVAAYGNTLDAGFHLDDLNFTDAPNVHLTSLNLRDLKEAMRGNLYANPAMDRPLAYLSFALNYYVGGLNVRGYHVVNLLIHWFCGAGFFVLVYLTLTGPRLSERYSSTAFPIALVSALLWTAHPIHTQAVTYVIQRMTSMAALFFILSLVCYAYGRTRAVSRTVLWYGGAVFFGVCAVATKEHTIVLPIVVLFYDRYFLHRPDETVPDRLWKKTGLWIGGVVLVVVFGLLAGGGGIVKPYLTDPWTALHTVHPVKGFTPYERLLSETRVLFHYLGLIAAPFPDRFNAAYYDYPKSTSLLNPPSTAVALLGIILLLAFALFSRKRAPLASFAILWFFLCQAVESSILPLYLVFEHREYLPSMWLFTGVTALVVSPFSRWRSWVFGGLAALVVVLCVFTHERNKVWLDEYTLWTDIVHKSPGSAVAHSYLGNALLFQRRYDEAIRHYKRAIEIKPDYGDAWGNLGAAFLKKGDPVQAVQYLRAAISYNRGYPFGLRYNYWNLGNAYLALGQHELARRAFAEAERYRR